MKKERKNLVLLLSILMVLLSVTMYIALKMDMNPSIQRKNAYSKHAGKLSDLESAMVQVRELIQQEEYNEAIELLNHIIEKFPDESAPRLRLGSIYYQQKNYVQAEQTFRELLLLHPDNAAAYNNLGESLIRQNRLPDAQKAIDQAMLLAPDNYEIILNGANLYATLREDEKAIQLLEQALQKGARAEMVTHYRELMSLQERPAFQRYIQKNQD